MSKVERTKTKICMEIETCQECPFCVEERHWTSDSWEYAYDYFYLFLKYYKPFLNFPLRLFLAINF